MVEGCCNDVSCLCRLFYNVNQHGSARVYDLSHGVQVCAYKPLFDQAHGSWASPSLENVSLHLYTPVKSVPTRIRLATSICSCVPIGVRYKHIQTVPPFMNPQPLFCFLLGYKLMRSIYKGFGSHSKNCQL